MIRGIPGSLAGRLIGALALLQSAVVLGGMVLWMLTSPYVTMADVAASTTTRLVAESVARGADGAALLRPGPALRAYALDRPDLTYAALLEGAVLPGGDPALADALARLGPLLPSEGQLALPLPGGGTAKFAPAASSLGPVIVVSAGNRFRLADDLGSFLGEFALQLVPMFGPALLAAMLAVPLLINAALAPLRRSAQQVAQIGPATLHQRLAVAPAPTELRPFLGAINSLLARVEDGVKRQRVFTANAAHELRTPVAVLQARAEAMPLETPGRTDLLRDLRRITILLDQLLAVARWEALEAALAEPLDLVALAREVVGDLAPLALRAGLALEVLAPPGRLPAQGNAQALASALANLVENALRAEPAGGTVTVRVGPDPCISVQDHGPGVAPEDLPLLFQPFWRKREDRPGSGLGLAIVAEVARLHGGEVSVAATPGGGATFTLRLGG